MGSSRFWQAVVDTILMSQIKIPIIIAEGFDVTLYTSISDAELDLEAVDVKEGIFRGYDAEGRLLDISTNRNKVVICPAEEDPHHAKELQIFLTNFLKTCRPDIVLPQNRNLDSLIEACKEYTYVAPKFQWKLFAPLNREISLKNFKEGMVISAIVSLVLGLLSVMSAVPVVLPFIGLALGVNGLLKEIKRAEKRKALMIITIIGLVLNAFVTVMFVVGNIID